jgi:hypothetical protein
MLSVREFASRICVWQCGGERVAAFALLACDVVASLSSRVSSGGLAGRLPTRGVPSASARQLHLSPVDTFLARRAQRKAAAARAEAEAKAAKARTLQEAVAARVVAEQRARMTQQTVASLRVEREAALQALRDKSAAEAQRAKVRRERTTDRRGWHGDAEIAPGGELRENRGSNPA